MKTPASISILLFFINVSFAQDYIPLIEQNKHHFVSSIESAGWYNGYISFVMRGDTLIEETSYTKVYRQFFENDTPLNFYYEPPYELRYEELFAVVREDLVEREVHARLYDLEYINMLLGWECDPDYEVGEEMLLYDFGQELGDTMQFCPKATIYAGETLVLDTIYVENIQSEDRRVFGYRKAESIFEPDHYIYEGLGGREGIFSQLYSLVADEGWYSLRNICIGTNEECGVVDLVSTENVLPLQNEISISPNPNHGSLQVSLSSLISRDGLFNITDLTGRIVYSESLKSGIYTCDLDLPQGFYSASFQQKGEILWQEKLIVLE